MNDAGSHPGLQQRSMVCPYCGGTTTEESRCASCRGLLDPLSRQATQNDMGPWFIRDESGPFFPGCSFQRLAAMVRRGRISGATVIRGPTTRQFWMPAERVPGVASLLGRCHNCRAEAKPEASSCGACGASFVVPVDRQSLGLAPIYAIPGQAAPIQTEPVAQAVPPRTIEVPPREQPLRLGADSRPSRGALAAALIAAGGLFVVLWLLIADARFGLGLGFADAVLGERHVSAPNELTVAPPSGVHISLPVPRPAPEPEPDPGIAETVKETEELKAATLPAVDDEPDPGVLPDSALRAAQKRLRGLP